jgi:hypothetical protein
LGRVDAVEVIDPDAGIDPDHRSDLMASNSPSHLSFPLNALICSCFFQADECLLPGADLDCWGRVRRTSSGNGASTAYRNGVLT